MSAGGDLPSNQPVGKIFMGSLTSHYSGKVTSFLRHSSKPLSDFELMELFDRVYAKEQRGDIAVNGFNAGH